MPKIPIIPGKDYVKALEKYGCDLISIRGSHHKMFNPTNNETSIVAVHAGKDIGKGAFSSTLKQLGIDVDDFIKTL